MPHPLSQRISDVLALDPVAPAIQYEGQWLSWGQLDDMARQIGALTARHGNGDPPRVGILLRNSPAHVGALLGVLAGGGTVVVINPSRGDERTRADISALRLPLVIGTPADIANLVTSSSETTLVAISTLAEPPEVTPAAAPAARSGPTRCRGVDADQRNHRTAQARRPDLRHAGAQRDWPRPRSVPGAHPAAHAGSPLSTHRWCTSAACFGCCCASPRRARSCCCRSSNSRPGRRPSASTGRGRYRWCPPHCEWCCTPT